VGGPASIEAAISMHQRPADRSSKLKAKTTIKADFSTASTLFRHGRRCRHVQRQTEVNGPNTPCRLTAVSNGLGNLSLPGKHAP
jgi:hypothetical protein